MNAPLIYISFIMVFIRISVILLMLPFFGSRNVPWQSKAGLAFFLAAIASFLVYAPEIPPSVLGLCLGVASEVVTGALIGLIVRLVFEGVQLAGEFTGYQLGFAIANVLDPASSEQVSVIAQFEQFLAFLIFLAINGHYLLIAALYKSFKVIPLGGFIFSAGLLHRVIQVGKEMFIIGVEVAAPVMVTLLITNIAMAVISKTMPQINVYFLGFPIQIGLGFIITGLSLPVFFLVLKGAFNGMMNNIFAVFKLIGGM